MINSYIRLFGEKRIFIVFLIKKNLEERINFQISLFVEKIKLTIFFAQLEALDFIHLIQVNK
jgi:hypothetical protein